MKNNSKTNKTLLSDAILIAVATSIIYVQSYSYERGILEIFGIPEMYVNTSIESFLKYILPSFLITLFVGIVIEFISMFAAKEKTFEYYFSSLFFVFMNFYFIYDLYNTVFGWIIFAVSFGAAIFFYVYKRKTKIQDEILVMPKAEKRKIMNIIILFIPLMIVLAPYQNKIQSNKELRDFLVGPIGAKDYVLVRPYKDYFIYAMVEKDTSKTYPSYILDKREYLLLKDPPITSMTSGSIFIKPVVSKK